MIFGSSNESLIIRFYALEWATASLEDYFDGFYTDAMPESEDGLMQLASGLQYIHGIKLVHLDLRPSNVLISTDQSDIADGKLVRLMIADFGLSKPTKDGSFTLISRSERSGFWMAPELWHEEDSDEDSKDDSESPQKSFFSVAVDVWAMGCIFFSLLTLGNHPFGRYRKRVWKNIAENNPTAVISKFLYLKTNKKKFMTVNSPHSKNEEKYHQKRVWIV